MRALILLLPVLIAAESLPTAPTVPPGQQRSEKAIAGGPMKYFPTRPDQAEVVSASFIGGPGHEFLVDGGILADGRVWLAGNVVGGEFGVAGATVTVIGRDGQRPGALAGLEPLAGKNQAPDRFPGWRHPQASGFLVRCSKDLKQIESVVRLPWLAASLTSLELAADGAIYIAGRDSGGLAGLGGEQATLRSHPDAERKGGECERTFVARLSPDGNRVEWVRRGEGLSDAPRLSLTRDGNVVFCAQDVRTFDPAGKELAVAVIPGGVKDNTSISPIDGMIVKGHEHHWPTGRQPYRCPTLWSYHPDGRPQYHLYDWGGPYVVLDGLFLVSDTAVRMVSHDREGNVLAVLWSDGGNSVAFRQPNDVRAGTGTRGCGCSGAGANATSFAYLVKLEPKDYRCIGMTLWCSQYDNKGNGASITALGRVDDGSLAFAGGSAWGLWQTGNKLANGEPAGQYIAVLNQDLTGVRYSSAVPGSGIAEVGAERATWGIASGTVDQKPKALFVGSAAEKDDVYGLVTDTPVVEPLQKTHGGGLCDGYAVLLDLSATTTPDPAAPRLPAAPPGIDLSLTSYGRRADAKPGRTETTPNEGEVYRYDPAFPKWTTCDAEFRARDGSMWPHFCYGRGASGQITWKGGHPVGSFAVALPHWCQSGGDQSRRVLGALIPPGFVGKRSDLPVLEFRVLSLGALQKEQVQRQRGAKPETLEVASCTAEAELVVAGRVLRVQPKCAVRTGLVHESSIRMTHVHAVFTIKGSDLGLPAPARDLTIDCRISMQGHAR